MRPDSAPQRKQTGAGSPPAPVGAAVTDHLVADDVGKIFSSKRSFSGKREVTVAASHVDLDVTPGSRIALVGESGCGKSTLARMLTGLLEPTSGSIHFSGRSLADLDREGMLAFRRSVQLIFQDPTASLNPRVRVQDTLGRPLLFHRLATKDTVAEQVLGLLESVGLEPEHSTRYPHQLSGGQRQRIAIARALSLSPRILIADEPVSALDVTIQTELVRLLLDLQEENGFGLLFISHDIGLVQVLAEEVLVMYRGRVVERGTTADVLERPRHPYTVALLQSVPVPDPRRRRIGDGPAPVRGDANDDASGLQPGCPYAARCDRASALCQEEDPGLERSEGRHPVACHHPIG